MARNNQQPQTGNVLSAALTGTGSAATLFAAQAAGIFVDITSLVLTNTTVGTNVVATLSDGTVSYVFNVGQPVCISFPTPLKATTAATAWTLNAAAAVSAVATAVTATS